MPSIPSFLAGRLVLGTIIAATLGTIGYWAAPGLTSESKLQLIPPGGTYEQGDTFDITVEVSSGQQVNVFGGEVHFSPELLTVESISYNTSVADLWAEKPWHENGEGVVHFAGGTTYPGGFIGTDELLTITFKSEAAGSDAIALRNVRILLHDGLGTDADVPPSIDRIITIDPPEETSNAEDPEITKSSINVVEELVTDVNGDGQTSFADVSALMFRLGSDNAAADINNDGTVNTADLSILLEAL